MSKLRHASAYFHQNLNSMCDALCGFSRVTDMQSSMLHLDVRKDLHAADW